ncbi:flagella synthesis protein FlgN [Vibrio panuliri]|uniref:Molecular chaperone n=1 Tax=Vibrio panuliri TaxID=1381081 RepID=A0A1Q9HMK4_9VIBR|nr:flagellar export chaperone FlgN [Vibrio panuliri]KAB1453729.1 flagellar protein FlgN [Vibrio panuliri]OLQ91913.1 molecular chaperone [Vibrio panuliri]OLQ96446.1 molecular chaperone [Vibrio panuliri]
MATLKSLVEFQLKSASELSELLEKEQVAIAQRSAKEIESIAHQKNSLVLQLQTTDERIARHPEVESLKSDPELVVFVDQIRHTITECQQLNDVNGEALQRAQLSFNKLDNLMKQSQGKMGMTYTAKGHTRNVSTLGTNLKA